MTRDSKQTTTTRSALNLDRQWHIQTHYSQLCYVAPVDACVSATTLKKPLPRPIRPTDRLTDYCSVLAVQFCTVCGRRNPSSALVAVSNQEETQLAGREGATHMSDGGVGLSPRHRVESFPSSLHPTAGREKWVSNFHAQTPSHLPPPRHSKRTKGKKTKKPKFYFPPSIKEKENVFPIVTVSELSRWSV